MEEEIQTKLNKPDLKVKSVFSGAWELFTNNIRTLVILAAIPSLIILANSLIGFTIFESADDVAGGSLGSGVGVVAVLFFIATIVLSIIASIFVDAGAIKGLLNNGTKEFSAKEGLKLARNNFTLYLTVSLTVVLYVFGGLLLLIVPGILFAVWYSMAPIIALDKGVDTKQALSASKALVRPNLGALAKLYLVLVVLGAVFGALFDDYLSSAIFNLFSTAFGVAFYVVIYNRLSKVHEN